MQRWLFQLIYPVVRFDNNNNKQKSNQPNTLYYLVEADIQFQNSIFQCCWQCRVSVDHSTNSILVPFKLHYHFDFYDVAFSISSALPHSKITTMPTFCPLFLSFSVFGVHFHRLYGSHKYNFEGLFCATLRYRRIPMDIDFSRNRSIQTVLDRQRKAHT